MRERLVAHFEGDFSDVELISGQQLGSFFDTELSKVQREWFAGPLFDQATKIVGSATDVA